MIVQLAFRWFIIGIKTNEQTLYPFEGYRYMAKEAVQKESRTDQLSDACLAVLIPHNHLR